MRQTLRQPVLRRDVRRLEEWAEVQLFIEADATSPVPNAEAAQFSRTHEGVNRGRAALPAFGQVVHGEERGHTTLLPNALSLRTS